MFQSLMGPQTQTQINMTHQTHKHLIKKSYFDKSTNRSKDLEFLEDYDLFIIEVITTSNYRVKYEIYDDENTTVSKGVIQDSSPNKNIVISSNKLDNNYFVLIQVYTENNDLVESTHRFVSRNRVAKLDEDKKKTNVFEKKKRRCNLFLL